MQPNVYAPIGMNRVGAFNDAFNDEDEDEENGKVWQKIGSEAPGMKLMVKPVK